MQSCYIGGSLQSLQGRAGIHNRPTVLTMPPIHLMQNDVLDLTNRCRRRMKTPCRRAGRTVRHRNCNVKLDDLDWDRPDLDCELQQARGIPRNLRLDETNGVVLSRFMLRPPDLGCESLPGCDRSRRTMFICDCVTP